MKNDILNVDLSLIDTSINSINEECKKKLISNNKELKQLLIRLTSEEWVSHENQEFIKVMDKYIEKLNTISLFYEQVIRDLQKIKLEMEEEMNTTPSVHFNG